MIPKEAFIALSLIMVSAWAFGAVCDRMITRWFDSLYKPKKKPERRSCDNCKYEHTDPKEYPCKECADDDVDMWTPAYIDKCETCIHKNKTWDEEPCDECACGEKWEANR